MTFALWYAVVGLLLIALVLLQVRVRRLPLTTSMLYLAAGLALGPPGLGLIRLDPVGSSALLERLAELAVIVSLFSAGLKLRLPRDDWRWGPPLRLAFGSMALTVGLIALVGWAGLGLPIGAAVLLGAVLAPTDPVLASDVQVEDAADTEPLRFALTGEAGLNDGTAFPFVMLGVGLLGLHDLGAYGWRWLVVDVAWAIAGGLAVGWLLGSGLARLVVDLRHRHREAVGLDEFLAIGLIFLSYGAALLLETYGFLAVFAAGLAVRRVERESSGAAPPEDVRDVARAPEEKATDPRIAPAYMAEAVLHFNEQLERIAEVAVMLLVGGVLAVGDVPREAAWFVPLLLLVIRPVAVVAGLAGSRLGPLQRGYVAWFGIRGIGSIYYLMHGLEHGVSDDLASRLTGLTLAVVAVSVVVHGASVTPLMRRYGRAARGGDDAEPAA